MSNALKGVVIFTVIEIVTMVLWLYFATRQMWLSVAILSVGLLVEHYVSVNVGAGRSPFGSLPPDK